MASKRATTNKAALPHTSVQVFDHEDKATPYTFTGSLVVAEGYIVRKHRRKGSLYKRFCIGLLLFVCVDDSGS